jgi:hypothetical protein
MKKEYFVCGTLSTTGQQPTAEFHSVLTAWFWIKGKTVLHRFEIALHKQGAKTVSVKQFYRI